MPKSDAEVTCFKVFVQVITVTRKSIKISEPRDAMVTARRISARMIDRTSIQPSQLDNKVS